MRIKVTLAIRNGGEHGDLITREYEHVKDIGVTQPGLYTLMNVDGLIIAQFPLGMIAAVEGLDNDTALTIIPGKQVNR